MIYSLALFIFCGCMGLMVYSYLVYPSLMGWCAKRKDMAVPTNLVDERVIILMSVFNEETVIKAKIDSYQALNYSKDKLEFWIGSDASHDATNSIIEGYLDSSIRLFAFEERRGKAMVINDLMLRLKEEINEDALILMTDANVLFNSELLRYMVPAFEDRKLGQLGATIYNTNLNDEGISKQESQYIQGENKLKFAEGECFGAMIGAFGACYMIRKSLLLPIPEGFLMEDFYISLNVLRKGFRAKMMPSAICFEDLPASIDEEFKRKQRISIGNFQNLSTSWDLLFRFNGISFCYFSHKIIRWFGPFLLIVAFGAALYLAAFNVMFKIILGLGLFFTSIIFLHRLFKIKYSMFKPLKLVLYFFEMNLALLIGFLRFLKGNKSNVWQPTKREV